MRVRYEKWTPGQDAIDVIQAADAICRDYASQGYDLTLRQLYYQFVARGLIPNTDRSYKRLGSIVNKARMAGLLDWDHIVDRTRNMEQLTHWRDPAHIIGATARSFHLDRWTTQDVRVEVWVEKEALAGVISQVADRWDCPWFSCRGYVSQSEMWGAAQRLRGYIADGKRVVLLHLGDHDPSGIDMTRDIRERLEAFIQQDWLNDHMDVSGTVQVREIWEDMQRQVEHDTPLEVRRIALTMEQVREYEPPPNPAKLTDSRSGDYCRLYGDESWELDALDPATMDELITQHVVGELDMAAWDEVEADEERHTELLRQTSRRWADVVRLLGDAS